MDKINDLGPVKRLMDGGDESSLKAGKWSEWKCYPSSHPPPPPKKGGKGVHQIKESSKINAREWKKPNKGTARSKGWDGETGCDGLSLTEEREAGLEEAGCIEFNPDTHWNRLLISWKI